MYCYSVMCLSICFLFVYSESEPQLEMNATANEIVDGETVSISCSLKYATARNMNLSISVIQHPGSDAIDTDTQLKKNSNDIHSVKSVTTVKANSQKNREGATVFGPVKCTIELTVTTSAAVVASNRVQFTSDEIPEFFIACKFFNKDVVYVTIALTLTCYKVIVYLWDISLFVSV